MARDQFDIKRCRNQHEVVPFSRPAAAQPITRGSACAQTHYGKTGQTSEKLSTGKGHGSLTSETLGADAGGNKIHLTSRKDKGSVPIRHKRTRAHRSQ
jgi:hypothetical protein